MAYIVFISWLDRLRMLFADGDRQLARRLAEDEPSNALLAASELRAWWGEDDLERLAEDLERWNRE